MTKTILSILLILLLAFPSFAGEGKLWESTVSKLWESEVSKLWESEIFAAAPPSPHCDDATHDGDGNAIIRCEDFEGSADCYDGTLVCRGAFSYASAMDFDQNATKLEGNYSAANLSDGYFRQNYTAADAMYGYILYNPTTFGGRFIITIQNSGANVCRIYTEPDGSILAYGEGTNQLSVNKMSVLTTYSVWFGYTKGTGNNSQCWACFSTDPSSKPARPDNACASVTDGTNTIQTDRMEFGPYNTNQIGIFDHIRINTTEFGASPP